MITSVTGVILAGGKSSRMGRNKALLPMPGAAGGRPRIIDAVAQTMSALFSRVILSVHEAGVFPDLSLPEVVDRYPETGPIGGITSVLESGEANIFCVACDMPFLNPELIEYLCGFADCDVVVPVWRGKIETLHAVYSGSMLPHFQESLKQNRFRITDSFAEVHARYVQEPEIKPFDPAGASFRNVNTPEEYGDLV
jgi:molybdopterin-guanine dinucleotide biosynthesis protein A